MKAVGYVRVSTEEQSREGVSLEAQREKIEFWAKAHDAELIAVEADEGISGGRMDNRPALQRAIALACKKKAALVVYSMSRMSRSTKDTIAIVERLQRSKANLVSLTESFIDTTSPSGEMMYQLFSVLAQFERKQIAERTRHALASKRAKGQRISRFAPYGYRFTKSGQVVPCADEQRTCQAILKLRAGGKSYRAIAAVLEKRRIPNRAGKLAWRPNTIADVIKREGRNNGAKAA